MSIVKQIIKWDYASWVSKLKEAPTETNGIWVSSGESSLSLLDVLKLYRMKKEVMECIEGIYKRILNS